MWGRWPWAAARRFRSSPCATRTPRTRRRPSRRSSGWSRPGARLSVWPCRIWRRRRKLARSNAPSTSRWSRTFILTISLRSSARGRGWTRSASTPATSARPERVRAVADACRERGIPIRIGVNGGSMEKDLLRKYGGVTAEALVESALGHVRLLNDCGFDDICISVKCSDVPDEHGGLPDAARADGLSPAPRRDRGGHAPDGCAEIRHRHRRRCCVRASAIRSA